MGRCAREKRSVTDKLGGTAEAYGVGENRNPSARTPACFLGAGVDEADVHRSIRRVRLGPRAVVRAATNLGGDAGDKTPLTPVEVLMEGLRQLEYRGYDSAGLALQLDGRIETIKQAGRLGRLAEALGQRNGDLSEAWAGVGHTRWATHGPPNEANAHPQIGAGVAVVHNGIIENFAKLKEELIERGVSFTSDTDTEVIAHLLAEGMEDGAPLREALAAALLRLEGSFAVAALSAREPGKVVGARHQSPLVVGLGEDENYLASAV